MGLLEKENKIIKMKMFGINSESDMSSLKQNNQPTGQTNPTAPSFDI